MGRSRPNILDSDKQNLVLTDEVDDHVRYTEVAPRGVCKLGKAHEAIFWIGEAAFC